MDLGQTANLGRSYRPSSPSTSGLPTVGLWALALSLGLAAGLGAQESPSTFSDDVEVRLVEVEVHVTDRKGHPLAGLTQEHFELEVNGEVKEIEYFEAGLPGSSSQAGAEVDAKPSGRVAQPLYLAVYVDRRFMQPGEMESVRSQLRMLLENSLGAEDQVLLATADSTRMSVLQSYTGDHESVLELLEGLDGTDGADRLANKVAGVMRQLRQERRFNEAVRGRGNLRVAADFEAEEDDVVPIDPADRARRSDNPRTALLQVEKLTDEINGELSSVARQLGVLVNTLTGLPGRKQVLYLGGTLPVRAPFDLFQAWREVYDRSFDDSDFFRQGVANSDLGSRSLQDLTADSRRYTAGMDVFNSLAERAGAAEVTFHTVNLSSLNRSRASFTSSADVEIGSAGVGSTDALVNTGRRGLAMDDGLATLALYTGGRHESGTRKLGAYFAGLAGDLKARYLLGFTADPVVGEKQNIKVRLKPKGDRRLRRALVRHRSHFMVKSRAVELAERTLAYLMIDSPSANPLGVEVDVSAPEARAEDWRLNLKVKVPLAELVLVPDRGSHSGSLLIVATAGALERGFAPVMQARVPVRLSNRDLLTALGRMAEYELELRVPKDPGRVSITVRDEYAPLDSSVIAEVGKPDWLVEEEQESAAEASADDAAGSGLESKH